MDWIKYFAIYLDTRGVLSNGLRQGICYNVSDDLYNTYSVEFNVYSAEAIFEHDNDILSGKKMSIDTRVDSIIHGIRGVYNEGCIDHTIDYVNGVISGFLKTYWHDRDVYLNNNDHIDDEPIDDRDNMNNQMDDQMNDNQPTEHKYVLQECSEYKNGEKHGSYISFYDNMGVESTCTYKNDKVHGFRVIYMHGGMKDITLYNNGIFVDNLKYINGNIFNFNNLENN